MSKPTCKVHGMIQPGAMCSMVIVGGKYCGFTGDCPHKSCAEMIVEHVKEMASTLPAAQAATDKSLTRCAAARDGDCSHKQCPQLRDNEPRATGRHCPLDTESED